MESELISGACLCGAVRFSIRAPVLFCGHCHCSMCRRAHGAGFVTWVGVLASQFTLRSGAHNLIRYRSSDHGTRSFCASCGSTLFFSTTQHPDRLDVVRANLDDTAHLPAQFHAYWNHRAPWVSVADDLPRLGGATGLEPL